MRKSLLRAVMFCLAVALSPSLMAAIPTVTTSAATNVTNVSVSFAGTVNPNGSQTSAWFRYGITHPGTCNDSFGTRLPQTGSSDMGYGSFAVQILGGVSGLSPATTYYYCTIASNASGYGFGNIVSFTTADAPYAVTSSVTSITSSAATLNGAGNGNGDGAYGYFRYANTSPGTCNDTFGTRTPSSSTSDSYLGASTLTGFSRSISGLSPATTYYFCGLARNAYGTGYGAVLSFTTNALAPTVVSSAATGLGSTTAVLNGSANPGGGATTAWFRYAASSPGTCNDTFGTRAPASGGSSLGAGTSSVAFSQAISGLTARTTYYVCAIAQNSAATSVSSVIAFTTAGPPTANTLAATGISNVSATLNGSGNPNASPTTAWFRYGATNPGTCNDTFGTRAPATGALTLGSGSSEVPLVFSIGGLSPGTTYYYCAITTNYEGSAFGSVVSFTTAAAPTMTTGAASSVASTSATLNGSGDPNGDAAYGYFRYATTSPGTCNDTFGTRAPSSAASDSTLGSGTAAVSFTRALTGLAAATTYYFCAIGRNAYGTGYGSVLSFTTGAAAPSVTTGSATSATATGATLNGSAAPGGAATTAWFRYSTSSPGTCNDTFGTRAPAAGGASLGAGSAAVPFSQAITGLARQTTYYACAIAQNSAGTSVGAVVSFTTAGPPMAITATIPNFTNTTAVLNGIANPNGLATTGWFRYSTAHPGTCNDIFGSRAPATGGASLGSGTDYLAFSQSISGLSPGTTYYTCAIASNSEGTAFGSVYMFTTATAPGATTSAATSVSATGATLGGNAVAHGDATYGYFRYATTNPGTCNDTFGTRAPGASASDTLLGADAGSLPFTRALTGLTPGTTYYFCAIARNAYGNGFGAVLTFTTSGSAPTVTTGATTSVRGTSAQLNASANPGGSATTGWFRYATTSPGGCNDSFGTRAPASGGASLGSGTSAVPYAQAITGLSPQTTYYACAIAQNAAGIALGSVVSFTTGTASARGDLDGDGRSDILWRNTATGQVFRMRMDGLSIVDGAMAYTEPNTAWQIVGDGDAGGDGVSDLLWRNTATGQVYLMPFSAGGMPSGGTMLYAESNLTWRIVHTPDLDGDGHADILWWNWTTGQVYAMLMSGSTIRAEGFVYTEPNTTWRIVATGDFTGSGKADGLVWRNASTGQVFLMTVSYAGAAFSQTGRMIYEEPNTAWQILGAPDLNGDGKSDLLWRNSATGQVYAMLMNGPAVATEAMVHQEPNVAWKIVASGDYDGDGRSDLLWRNDTTGQVYMMLMNGSSIASQAMVYQEPNTAWRIVGPWEYGLATGVVAAVQAPRDEPNRSTFEGAPLNEGRIAGEPVNAGAGLYGEPLNAPREMTGSGTTGLIR